MALVHGIEYQVVIIACIFLQCAQTFISLMTKIAKEQTVQYVLTLVDDLLEEDRERTRLFSSNDNKKHPSPWVGFMNMLNRPDKFTVHQVFALY